MSVHDRWRGARTGDGQRWEVRWREGGSQRKRRFGYKQAAEAFDAQQRISPEVRRAREGRSLTVDKMMATWLATKSGMRPKTLEACELDAREVTAEFGRELADDLRPSDIRRWSVRDRGASIRRRSLAALRQAYRLAVADQLLATDLTAGIPLPKTGESDRRALSWVELDLLATEAGPHAPMIWLLGTCGLRLGEAIALDVADVGKSRLWVRSATTKTGKGRDVPVSGYVRDMLLLHDRAGAEPLFPGARSAGRLNPHWWRRKVFEAAAAKAGLGSFTVTKDRYGRRETYRGLTPHSLRHTAASLAIAAGADVKAVQRMLGHRSATLTLDLYGHLFDEHLDVVAERMSDARENALNR